MDSTSTSHAVEISPDKCHLLKIPPELRDYILEYLLISPKPLVYKTLPATRVLLPSDENISVPLDIACTCRQLSRETVSIYYGKNSFHFGDYNSMYRFLKNIGPGRRLCVKDVTIRLRHSRTFDTRDVSWIPSAAMKQLGQCGPLNKLKIDFTASHVAWHGPSNPYFRIPGVQGLRRLRGCKKFCVEWGSGSPWLDVAGSHFTENRMAKDQREFERVLQEEIYANPETEADREAKKEQIIAKQKQERDDRRATLRPRV